MLNTVFIYCLLPHTPFELKDKWKRSIKKLGIISFKAIPDADVVVNILSEFNQYTR